MTDVERVKQEIREDQYPYFDYASIIYYLEKNRGDVDATIYEMLLIKSENSSISVSGLNTNDMSSYFKRLASKFRPNHSGTLEG